MSRLDRTLVEELFADRHIQVINVVVIGSAQACGAWIISVVHVRSHESALESFEVTRALIGNPICMCFKERILYY